MKGSVSEETAKLGFAGSETRKFGIRQVRNSQVATINR